ncbi:hypothetical protein F2Q68_00018744 [Brassica cretica]|uniref:Uncharacterized protein n=2 Tax=Brassica cretica TaxID=69181 RepID=A0A8S9FWK8_BRACR|nr:hypothetical protein F2Q68_00018744 [Brassica cretica]KAF3565474.1 hypothetical protein DY000_02011084 [Brassica cretica]
MWCGDPMKASSFGGSSVKRHAISVSSTAGRIQNSVSVLSSGGSEGLESDLLRKPVYVTAGTPEYAWS